MSIHGDLYYEGKEFETRLKEKKPGDITDELRRALGMPTGQVSPHLSLPTGTCMDQQSGMGSYVEKPSVCLVYIHVDMNHRIIEMGMGAYTEMGAYSGHNGKCQWWYALGKHTRYAVMYVHSSIGVYAM